MSVFVAMAPRGPASLVGVVVLVVVTVLFVELRRDDPDATEARMQRLEDSIGRVERRLTQGLMEVRFRS